MSANPRDCREIAADAERQVIAETLARFKGSRVKTAQALNLDKSTLWRKMKKHRLL
jgi:transcriptional regulator with PAS, ATPase and Fis domain